MQHAIRFSEAPDELLSFSAVKRQLEMHSFCCPMWFLWGPFLLGDLVPWQHGVVIVMAGNGIAMPHLFLFTTRAVHTCRIPLSPQADLVASFSKWAHIISKMSLKPLLLDSCMVFFPIPNVRLRLFTVTCSEDDIMFPHIFWQNRLDWSLMLFSQVELYHHRFWTSDIDYIAQYTVTSKLLCYI